MMYLVTPAIYEKLLLCIEDGDKKLLENLNKPPNESQEKRPAQRVVDALSSTEINQDPQSTNTPVAPIQQISTFSNSEPIPMQQMSSSSTPVIIPQVSTVPIALPQQDQVPLSVTITPQDNQATVPMDVSDDQPVLIQPQGFPSVSHQNVVLPIPPIPVAAAAAAAAPPPPPPQVPQTVQLNPIKPVALRVGNQISQPANLFQPVRPLTIEDVSAVPLPEDDFSDWNDESVQTRGTKRPLAIDYQTSKRTNIDYDFEGRDERYRQNMWNRRTNRQRVQNNNPVRDLVQWQPVQCVQNTTGGTICNPDPDPTLSTALVVRSCSNPGLKKKSTCRECGVTLGDLQLLHMHMRLKHGKSFVMPGLEDEGASSSVTKKNRKKRFASPGNEPEIDPFEYDSSKDVSFRKVKEVKGKKRKRFTEPGHEPPAKKLEYEAWQDIPFRTIKTLRKTKKPNAKPTTFRCSICHLALTSVALLKKHILMKHQLDPNEVIRDMALTAFSNPQPGGSRDFNDWSSIRLQPNRTAARRQRFGQLNKTKEFHNWK